MAPCTQAEMKMGTDAGEPINVPARAAIGFQRFSYMWSLKKQNKKARLPQKEIRFCGFQRKGDKELEEGGQKAQTSS